ncbi:phBC6A51 family helix-turn-helix protein [Cohnella silvisoli]|uniref:PhBC6A51 family helix-turn-helix protein n=1 Tax=Cohnella silvisoli TaxID=2873699 RepID=A0ABV1KYY3_9BACL|nr:phBC6A51 family helix-turn-helix protein [Cohnella silvisoli]MCD9024326.1 helix-turn-helix domain-containing protein [Cohnella silvisoli]
MQRIETHHAIAIRWLALPKRGGKTMEEIAAECGVTKRSIYDWLKEPLFDRELKKEIVRQTTARIPEVMASLTDAVINDHNAAAAKLLLQVNGMLTDKVEIDAKVSETVDVEALKARILAQRA